MEVQTRNPRESTRLAQTFSRDPAMTQQASDSVTQSTLLALAKVLQALNPRTRAYTVGSHD